MLNKDSKEAKQTTLDHMVLKPKPQILFFKKRKRLDTNEGNILRYFKPASAEIKSSKLKTRLAQAQIEAPPAPIIVSYREDGCGRGACFDHLALQTITQKPTKVAKPSQQSLTTWEEHNKRITFHLPVEKNHLPAAWDGPKDHGGLLYLPGVASQSFKTAAYQERKKFELDLIRQAKRRGQPIIGICGGSWTLWESFGGGIIEVKEHNYRAGMPRVSETTGKIGYNVLIHDVELLDQGLTLQAALNTTTLPSKKLPVNSVHSYAADPSEIPQEVVISAIARQNDTIAPSSAHSRAGEEKICMKPQEESIEAFETHYGAPILGIQWHPEAFTQTQVKGYFTSNQQHLIQYMYQAGQTYLNRRLVLDELNSLFISTRLTRDLLKPIHSLSQNLQVIKKTNKGVTHFSMFKLKADKTLRHLREVQQEIEAKEAFLMERGFSYIK